MKQYATAEEPAGHWEFHSVDDIYIKQMHIAKADTFIQQHSHLYPHNSMLALGSVRVWKDGVLTGDFIAPVGIFIESNCKHKFMSLEDNTIIYCIHNLHGKENVQFEE